MRRKVKLCIIVAVVSIMLSGCCLNHEWQEATCTEPKQC